MGRPGPGPADPGPAASFVIPGDPKAAPGSCDANPMLIYVNPTLIRHQFDTGGSWNMQYKVGKQTEAMYIYSQTRRTLEIVFLSPMR